MDPCESVARVEEHVDGWFSIFLTNSRTREFWACFTTECGNPGIRKSMSTSFSIDRSLPGSWLASRPTTGYTVASCLTASSWKELLSISWERDIIFNLARSLGHHRQRVASFYHHLGLDLVGLLGNFGTQFFHPVMLQGDLGRRPRWRTNLLVYDFSSFHSNNFRNTISWKCVMKNDCVRSSLIECKSLLNRKININPKYCVLVFLPCFMQVLCMTRYTQVDRIRILVILVHGIHRQEEYCLSVAQNLTSRYQSSIDDGMWIDCTSDMTKCTWRNRPE